MPPQNVIAHEHLLALANGLAECLTNSEINDTLRMCGVATVDGPNKPRRIFNSLEAAQTRLGCANKAIEFVQRAMSPARYVKRREEFLNHLNAVNQVLVFVGYKVGEDGLVVPSKSAATLAEADERVRSLRAELLRRGVHAEVLRFCKQELLDKNYFHAVLEAAKSVSERVRTMSGLALDGHTLFDTAFGMNKGTGILALNARTTDSERAEHSGLVSLLRFLFSSFRNPVAHEPRIYRPMDEARALEVFSMISYAHHQLDLVTVIPVAMRKP